MKILRDIALPIQDAQHKTATELLLPHVARCYESCAPASAPQVSGVDASGQAVQRDQAMVSLSLVGGHACASGHSMLRVVLRAIQ